MCRNIFVGTVCVLFSCVTSVFAAPVIDGNLADPFAEGYNLHVEDANGESYLPGFDIDELFLVSDASWLYLGLSVESGAIDTNGGSDSWAEQTVFILRQYDDDPGAGGSLTRRLVVALDGAGVSVARVYDAAGVFLSDVTADVAVSTGLEMKLSLNAAVWGPIPADVYYKGALDNTDEPADDVIAGAPTEYTPEPATMSLLLVGLGTVVLRKRRRRE